MSVFVLRIQVVRLHSGDATERERLKRNVMDGFKDYDVVITTYEMVNAPNMRRVLSSAIAWRYLVIDEGHKVTNTRCCLVYE